MFALVGSMQKMRKFLQKNVNIAIMNKEPINKLQYQPIADISLQDLLLSPQYCFCNKASHHRAIGNLTVF